MGLVRALVFQSYGSVHTAPVASGFLVTARVLCLVYFILPLSTTHEKRQRAMISLSSERNSFKTRVVKGRFRDLREGELYTHVK